MIKQTAAALLALALSLPALSETPAQQPTVGSAKTEPAKKIVKTIDFTKPNKNAPLFAEVVNPKVPDAAKEDDPLAMVDFGQPASEEKAISSSQAIAKARSYTVRGKTYQTLASSDGFTQEGKASWYGPGFHGRKTASGEVFNMNEMTAAHKRLPLGTRVKVTNLANGKSVVVRITDRGPFHGNRIIDLSKAAAKELGVIASGTADVSIAALK